MNYQAHQTIPNVVPGHHVLTVEFVAADHLPFDPRVVAAGGSRSRVSHVAVAAVRPARRPARTPAPRGRGRRGRRRGRVAAGATGPRVRVAPLAGSPRRRLPADPGHRAIVSAQGTRDPVAGAGASAPCLAGLGAIAARALLVAPAPPLVPTTVGVAELSSRPWPKRRCSAAPRSGSSSAAASRSPSCSSLAFALIHVPAYGWPAFPVDFGAGLLFSWQRLSTGRWSVPAATHAAANLVAVMR
jgi:hypothetical protein